MTTGIRPRATRHASDVPFGRFSRGLEYVPVQEQPPLGRFGDGVTATRITAGERRIGRFADGLAALDGSAASLRLGDFADGQKAA